MMMMRWREFKRRERVYVCWTCVSFSSYSLSLSLFLSSCCWLHLHFFFFSLSFFLRWLLLLVLFCFVDKKKKTRIQFHTTITSTSTSFSPSFSLFRSFVRLMNEWMRIRWSSDDHHSVVHHEWITGEKHRIPFIYIMIRCHHHHHMLINGMLIPSK